jgi:hypothetical protein
LDFIVFFMDAIIVDLKDFAVRTPEQVVRVFYQLYNRETVKTALWNLFVSISVGQNNDPDRFDEAKSALLFDQLIALVEAVEKLRSGESDAQHCVVCGSKRENGLGEGS